MKIFVFSSSKYAGEYAAIQLMKEVKENPRIVLGLSTGLTMIPFYAELIKIHKNEKLSFSEVRTFNIDEYCSFGENDEESLRFFMDKHFFNKIDILKENINFLNGKSDDYEKECENYEIKIKEAGGIDLMILGIGRNAHIGFNEPGSDSKSRTRKVELSKQTLNSNKIFFKDKIPEYALTIGVQTILESKKIILLALSKRKSEAIQNSFGNPSDVKYPASFLQKHNDTYLILDEKSSSSLSNDKNFRGENLILSDNGKN